MKLAGIKPTDGPWHQGVANPHVVYAADQTTVCICNQTPDDAQLIAAAPMLLKVMRTIAQLAAEQPIEEDAAQTAWKRGEDLFKIKVWAEKAVLLTEHSR